MQMYLDIYIYDSSNEVRGELESGDGWDSLSFPFPFRPVAVDETIMMDRNGRQGPPKPPSIRDLALAQSCRLPCPRTK